MVAQSMYVYPATVTAPRGSYQTCTAIVNGVNAKQVSWTTTGGTLVGVNPSTANEPATIALYTTTAGTYTVTATSLANGSLAGSCTITMTGSPAPTVGHPRLLLTPSMVTALQAKAVSTNPMWTTLQTAANNSYANDSAIWSWSCNGGTGLPSSDQTQNWPEGDAHLFALMSLIDPSASNRAKWGCYGRDIMVYMMNALLNNANEPIDGNNPLYGLTGNRGSDNTVAWTTTPDWLMAGGFLSSSDLNVARRYFAIIGQEMSTDAIGTGAVAYIGNYNSPQQFHTGSIWDYSAMRARGNNYSRSKEIFLAAAALTFDNNSTDDPPLANTCSAAPGVVCPDGTAYNLHSYFNFLVGGDMYLDWAATEDPGVTVPAYQAAYGNLSTQPACGSTWGSGTTPCFGINRGGESPEGSWYRYSTYRTRYLLNILHTAGYDDPILYGPQMSYGTSSWWDLHYIAELSFLTGIDSGHNPNAMGEAFYNFTTGDTYQSWRSPNDYWDLAATLSYDTMTGRSDRSAALEWAPLNVAGGGPNGTTYPGCTSYCGFVQNMSNDIGNNIIFDFLFSLPATDPTVAPPADPRPNFPTDWYDAGNQHILVRSGWSTAGATGTAFSYYAPNTAIDHEDELAGRFDIYSNGEYITKGRIVFVDYNYAMAAANANNEASYMQPANPGCSSWGCFQYGAYLGGGEIWHAIQNGTLSLNHSELPGYVGANLDLTPVYNTNLVGGYPYFTSVPSASRSLVYLRATNQVVYYDRGTTATPQAHYLSLITTGPLTINGNTATWPTRSGNQKACYTGTGGSLTDAGLPTGNLPTQAEDWQPYTTLQLSAGTVTSSAFLSTLEWGSSSFTCTTTRGISSSSGQSFQGTTIGSSLVMFSQTYPAAFAGTTFPASGATSIYISDLAPSTTYTITGAGTPASATTDNAGVLTFADAGTGNITVSAGASGSVNLTSITVTPSSASVITLGNQQFTATCGYSDGSSSNCTSSVTWASSVLSVATINSSGVVTGVGQGGANIIATSGSITGQAAVTVPIPTLQSIAVTPASATVSVGTTQQFRATGTYSDSSTSDLTASVTWSSSNTAMATVNSSGLATAMAQGRTNILVANGSVQAQAAVTVMPTATVTFSPAGGTYNSAQTVTISTTASSATIYYTTNGSTPTTSSAIYSGPITVSSTETLEAIAVASGYTTGAAGSASYTINPLAAATPTFSPAGGTYTSAQTVTISTTTPSATIYYTTNGSTPTTSSAIYSGPITVSSTETLEAIAVASGYTTSAAGVAGYTINPLAAATPTFSPAGGTYTSAQTVTIATTTPSATIYYTTNGLQPTTKSTVYSGPITVSATETLQAVAIATVYPASAVGSASYTINLPASTPTFSPAGGTYTSAQTVAINTATPSATIHYTIDGSAPTTSSAVYSGPITVSASETLQAIAVASGSSASAAGSASYTINLPASVPTFSPAGGTYTSAQTVAISTTTPSATIHYTTNGSAPTTSSAVYSGPIAISSSETLQAIAVASGYSTSAAGSASYTINLPASTPTFSPAGGTYTSAETVTISTTTPSATIHYTTDGSAPTTSSAVYSGPITVSSTETLQAIAVASGYFHQRGGIGQLHYQPAGIRADLQPCRRNLHLRADRHHQHDYAFSDDPLHNKWIGADDQLGGLLRSHHCLVHGDLAGHRCGQRLLHQRGGIGQLYDQPAGIRADLQPRGWNLHLGADRHNQHDYAFSDDPLHDKWIGADD